MTRSTWMENYPLHLVREIAEGPENEDGGKAEAVAELERRVDVAIGATSPDQLRMLDQNFDCKVCGTPDADWSEADDELRCPEHTSR